MSDENRALMHQLSVKKRAGDELSEEDFYKHCDLLHLESQNLVYGKSMLFDRRGWINGVAEKTNSFAYNSEAVASLLDILKKPYVQHFDWMCAPIYRDAIIFRDNNDKITLPLNICFSCHAIMVENDEYIIADKETYPMLKEWFVKFGHNIPS